MSVVFRFCVWAFLRMVMLLTGCFPRKYSICIDIFSFHFSALHHVCFLCLVLHSAIASVEITWCLRFCVWALLPRVMVMKHHVPKEHAICKYLSSSPFRALYAKLVVFLARRTFRRFLSYRRFFVAATRTIVSVDILFLKIPRI